MAEKTIEIKDLVVEYRTRSGVVQALNGLSLSIEKGKTLGLVGETGAGKTTAGLAVLGLIPSPPGVIVSGEILLNGKDLRALTDKEMDQIRGDAVAMIFQDPMTSLNPVMTVGDQIAEAIKIHEGLNHGDALKKAEEMLEMVGIPRERAKEYPHQFSGGMKQRVVIAIALSCTPGLLIADEPTTALDVTIQAQVLEMMTELKNKLNTSMILITHDLGVVAQVCDKVAIMYAGEIVEYGNLEDIYEQGEHPYTIGLFGSIPDLDKDTERLSPIAGLMPDPTKPIPGCRFADRCPHCMEICNTKAPGMADFDGHQIKCFLYLQDEKNGGEGK